MLKSDFFFSNLVDLLDNSGVVLSYGIAKDVSLGELIEMMPELDKQEQRELFFSAIDLLEARSLIRVVSSEDASLISNINVERMRDNFQSLRDLLDGLFSESGAIRDYKPNYDVIRKLRSNLRLLKGGK